jgi:predicted nucleic acid-binding protein
MQDGHSPVRLASCSIPAFLLDTYVISAVMQKRPDGAVVTWLDEQSLQDLWLPRVVVFELRYGAATLPVSRRRPHPGGRP